MIAKVERESSLKHEVSFKISEEEMSILQKKSAVIGMGVSELVREYVLDTALFDNSPFEEKKTKTRVSKKTREDS